MLTDLVNILSEESTQSWRVVGSLTQRMASYAWENDEESPSRLNEVILQATVTTRCIINVQWLLEINIMKKNLIIGIFPVLKLYLDLFMSGQRKLRQGHLLGWLYMYI